MIEITMIFQILTILIMCLAAYSDLKNFIIPNLYSALLILLFIAAYLLGFPFRVAIGSHLIHFFVALGLGLVLFRLEWFGGGDIKFYASLALWFGFSDALFLFLITVLCGGLIVIVRMTISFGMTIFGSASSNQKGKTKLFDRRIAYGVAIAAGGAASMLHIY